MAVHKEMFMLLSKNDNNKDYITVWFVPIGDTEEQTNVNELINNSTF